MIFDWCGSAKKDFLRFPEAVIDRFKLELVRLESGKRPRDGKPLQQVGRGAFEIRVRTGAGSYRVIYVARIAGRLAILHAFRKQRRNEQEAKSLAKKRYKAYLLDYG